MTRAWFKTGSVGYDAHLEKPLTFEKLERIAGQDLPGAPEAAQIPIEAAPEAEPKIKLRD